MKLDKENIMMIEFDVTVASIKFEMVALYNKNRISEEKVRNVIRLSQMLNPSNNENVVIMSKEQYQNVFLVRDEE